MCFGESESQDGKDPAWCDRSVAGSFGAHVEVETLRVRIGVEGQSAEARAAGRIYGVVPEDPAKAGADRGRFDEEIREFAVRRSPVRL